jgi:IclR family acetate operon transcriptional repressor
VPTVYHLVNTLTDSRLLTRDLQRRIHLGAAVATLGTAYAEQTAIPTEYLDVLKRIVDLTGENAYLSAWRDHNIVILAHMSGTHSVLVSKLREGYQGCAHARASGKILLAFAPAVERDNYLVSNTLQRVTSHTITSRKRFREELDIVAEQGYAVDEEEFTEGVACISVPVRNAGALIGAFTLTAPLDRYRAKAEQYLMDLRECVAPADY